MKMNKWLKKALALLLASTMTLAVGITAMASTGVTEYNKDDSGTITGVSSVTVNKELEIDDYVSLPSGTTFTVEVKVCGGSDHSDGYDGNTVYEGVEGGLVGGSISYDETSGSWSGELNVDSSKFSTPGVYHYIVSETEGNLTGMTYDTTKYDAYVYVFDDGSGNLYVAYVVIVGKDDEKGDLIFKNTYDTANLTLKKIISGSQADSTAKWTFTITITGCYEGQIIYYETSDGSYDSKTATSGGTIEITVELGNENTVKIYGLTEENEYSIIEAYANEDGYTTTYVVDDGNENVYSSGISGTISDSDGDDSVDDTSITVTNSKSGTTPTGVVLNYLPYILIVLCAGALAVVFFRRRRVDY